MPFEESFIPKAIRNVDSPLISPLLKLSSCLKGLLQPYSLISATRVCPSAALSVGRALPSRQLLKGLCRVKVLLPLFSSSYLNV